MQGDTPIFRGVAPNPTRNFFAKKVSGLQKTLKNILNMVSTCFTQERTTLSTPLWIVYPLFHTVWITVWKTGTAHTLPASPTRFFGQPGCVHNRVDSTGSPTIFHRIFHRSTRCAARVALAFPPQNFPQRPKNRRFVVPQTPIFTQNRPLGG